MPRSEEKTIRYKIKTLKQKLAETISPDGSFNEASKDTALELANLYRELNENKTASGYYEQIINQSTETTGSVGNYNMWYSSQLQIKGRLLFTKADMFRQLGLYDEAEQIYKSISDYDRPVADATKLSGYIKNTVTQIVRQAPQTIGTAVRSIFPDNITYTDEHLLRYKMALTSLGKLFSDRAANAATQEEANTLYATAIQFHLEAHEVNIPGAPDEIKFDLQSGSIAISNQNFHYFEGNLLAVGLIYEKMKLIQEAIALYKSYVEEYKHRYSYILPNNVRQAAMRLARLTNDLQYYAIATRGNLDRANPANNTDLELFVEELQLLSEYLNILTSKKHRKTLSPSQLEQNKQLVDQKFNDAERLISLIARTPALKQEWLKEVEKIPKFKIFATILRIDELHTQAGANEQFFARLETEFETARLDPKIDLLLKIIPLATKKASWFSRSDILVDKLLAVKDVRNFRRVITLATYHLTFANNDQKKFKEILDKVIKKIIFHDFGTDTKISLLNEILEKFNLHRLPAADQLQYKMVINKSIIDLCISKGTYSSQLSRAQFNLGVALEAAENRYPAIIPALETRLSAKLHDANYWFLKAMESNQSASDKMYSIIEAKLDAMPVKYKERLEQVLACDLAGFGSIILNPVSILVKLDGQPATRTYNANKDFLDRMYLEMRQTYRIERVPDLDPIITRDHFVNVLDPSTRQSVSKNIHLELDHNSMITNEYDLRQAISEYIIPNKALKDLIVYIINGDNVDIAEFPGFIDTKTGKRFIEPWLTKNGDTVDKHDPMAYCKNNKLLDIMQQFPSIKEMLSNAQANFASKNDKKALQELFVAAKQAELEGSTRFADQAKQIFIQYIKRSENRVLQFSQIDKNLSFAGMIDIILKKILGNEYDALKEIIICPITHEIPLKPVTLHSGNTYEELAIKDSLIISDRDPVTNKALEDTSLIANTAIASIIPEIIAPAHANQPVVLANLSALRGNGGKLFVDPYLTEDGVSVEKTDPKALRPNLMLKHLINHLAPAKKLKPTM